MLIKHIEHIEQLNSYRLEVLQDTPVTNIWVSFFFPKLVAAITTALSLWSSRCLQKQKLWFQHILPHLSVEFENSEVSSAALEPVLHMCTMCSLDEYQTHVFPLIQKIYRYPSSVKVGAFCFAKKRFRKRSLLAQSGCVRHKGASSQIACLNYLKTENKEGISSWGSSS